jgi:hypothetical protein
MCSCVRLGPLGAGDCLGGGLGWTGGSIYLERASEGLKGARGADLSLIFSMRGRERGRGPKHVGPVARGSHNSAGLSPVTLTLVRFSPVR